MKNAVVMFLLFTALSQIFGGVQEMDLRIIPSPQVVLRNYNDFRFGDNVVINLSNDNSELKFCAEELSRSIMQKIKAVVKITSAKKNKAAIELKLISRDELSENVLIP